MSTQYGARRRVKTDAPASSPGGAKQAHQRDFYPICPENTPENANDYRALQRPILAPWRVLKIEVFAGRWQSAVSSDGVAIEVRRLRPRALVSHA
jgi:hypothetical protein